VNAATLPDGSRLEPPHVVYSVVVPAFNEEATIPELTQRLSALLDQLDGPAEAILVDDGSHDATFRLMREAAAGDDRLRLVRLSRNFGHQIAITAGMDLAAGDAVIVMDADLQDPPEVVLELAEKWREGYDVVYAVRRRRSGETGFKRATASVFYRAFQRISNVDAPVDVGDFRLVDRRALLAFNAMRENNRFVRGMFSWIGFRQAGIEYERHERFAGATKYPLRKMLKFATDGIISFSNAPLRLALNLGFLVSIVAFLLGVFAIVAKLTGAYAVPGWASIVTVTAFLGGAQLVILGVMGEYIARIHEEVKNRPLYIVSGVENFPCIPESPPRALVFARADRETPTA
jgi:polyisoprenyl-phosphate glycosyltransferase